MNKSNKFSSRHERRLASPYSNLTNMSPTATPIYTRPHGGYRGVSEQYPLSVFGFDKPAEYLENVKNSVRTQYVEEENGHSGSPQWVPRYNSEINHTGEQPLIVQQYLSGNKQEQRNGVLPAHVDIPPRLKTASHRYREERLDYQHGNSTHQYLTATETPGQSEQLFDKKLGRPTRTSLLRTRYRSRSAPGVRALLEVNHLHKQQYMAAKTEDRFKSVDIPKDLQPMTDSGETIHQFITGARYNRPIFRDASYLAAAGVSVSKQGHPTPQHFQNGRSIDNGYLTSSSESFASTSLPNSTHPSRHAKEAWGSDSSLTIKSRPASRATSAAPTTTPLASRETFAPEYGAGQATATQTQFHLQQQVQHPLTGSKTIIDGTALHDGHPVGSVSGGCQDCVMCRKGVPFKGMPGTFSKKVDPAAKKTAGVNGRQGGDKVDKYIKRVGSERKDFDNTGHQLVQQYHLRILGVKMGVEENRSPTPRNINKHHFNSAQSPRSRPVSSRKQFNQNKNNSSRRSSDDLSIHEVNQENRLKDDEKNSMRSSMLSIRIDTPIVESDDDLSTPKDTPRDEKNDENEEQKEEFPGCHQSFEKSKGDERDDQPGSRVEPAEQSSISMNTCDEQPTEAQIDSLGNQIKDENGNHKTMVEEDAANNVKNDKVQGDAEVANVESLNHPTGMSGANQGAEVKGTGDNTDTKVDMSVITDAVKNIEIGKEGTDSTEKLPASEHPDNLTDG